MLWIRTWHTYLGILIAPSVLFFALTGTYQLFGLHEAHGTYTPPVLLEKLSMVHKDQLFAQRESEDKHAPPDAQPKEPKAPAAAEEHEHEPSLGTILLKWYFLAVALALTMSTGLGLWMGLTHIKHKRTRRWLLAAGIVIPVVLVLV
jgi:hypothetical protein